jgi:hypothetical protein
MPANAGTSDAARVTLAVIRLINGGLGLLVPGFLIRRLGGDPATSATATYALRMFGVRTVIMGADLLRPAGPIRDHAVQIAPIVHASDTVAAALLGVKGKVPRRVAVMTVAISACNTALAIVARSGSRNR